MNSPAKVGVLFLALVAIGLVSLGESAWKQPQAGPVQDVDANGDLFGTVVGPAFADNCLECHNNRDRKGGLSLQTGPAALRGGDSGQVIVPGDPASSYLLDLVTSHDGKAEMPKGASPLDEATVASIRKWISAGADWPQGKELEVPLWWSFAELTRPEIPRVAPERGGWVRTPIDAFIAAGHSEQGLVHAEEASRRTLIRRLTYDLTGLPPTPAKIEAFVGDTRPLAYERLVERLLASPRYGERWARHWLDVVHYGETHGYDKDKPRPHAWPYRDYVIRSFNADKPYSQFVSEQIAGDVLFPKSRDGAEALGFLAAGPWDFIGHVELPETKIDGQIARHLDRDDVVQNTITSFLSLTLGCAQCHDHKFDPISQQEYYQLQAVFAAIDRTNLPYDVDQSVATRRAAVQQAIDELATQTNALRDQVAVLGGEPWKEINAELSLLENAQRIRPPQYGYHSGIEPTQDVAKWVQVDLGQPVAISRIQIVPCHDDFNGIGAGFGFPVRYKIEVSNDPTFATKRRTIADNTASDVPNPGTQPQETSLNEVAQYVRVTATKLAPRANDFIFALAELRVWNAAGENLARDKTVTSLDSIEAPVRWARANLVDGLDPHSGANSAEIAHLRGRRDLMYEKLVPAKLRHELANVSAKLDQARDNLASLPPQSRVYAGAIHQGEGNFQGTGPNNGTPRPIHFLERGDVTSPGEVVVANALASIPSLPGELSLSPESTDDERRAALADWISSDENPLLWRSIANRVWQYHFGRGLVSTPNDFGRMGERPTHPELLDWLAAELRDSGGSIKHLHRLIVTSAVYRQASQATNAYAQVDPDNIYLARMNRRRLEAEAIHDAVLTVAGKLDNKMEGQSYQDFVIEKPEHSPHYRYELHDPNDPRSHRRAVYRMIVRSQTQPLLTALDCADPSMQVGKRNESNTPLQALSMLNNRFVVAMAQHFAARVRTTHDEIDQQIQTAFQLALGRAPNAEELKLLTNYTVTHGLENCCRVILNLSEFQYVD